MQRQASRSSRRLGLGVGQLAGLILAAGAVFGLFVPAGRAQAVVDTLLLLPPITLLVGALLTRDPVNRAEMAMSFASGPILGYTLLYQNAIAMARLGVMSPGGGWPPARTFGFIGAAVAAHYVVLVLLLPRRCPHCRWRALVGRGGTYRCEACGATCRRRVPFGRWDVTPPAPGEGEPWFAGTLPALRRLRRDLRSR